MLYLFYMAWSILRENGALDVSDNTAKGGMWRVAVRGTLLNVLNPKLSLFFLAFLPQFITPGAGDAALSLVGLAAAFMLMTFVVFVGYGACASLARDYMIRRPSVLRWFRHAFAGAFGFLGIKLASSE